MLNLLVLLCCLHDCNMPRPPQYFRPGVIFMQHDTKAIVVVPIISMYGSTMTHIRNDEEESPYV